MDGTFIDSYGAAYGKKIRKNKWSDREADVTIKERHHPNVRVTKEIH
ncbi:hypothetical protein [Streptococcus ovuberis]|nr:hypothetical protein [Streptococcus ovuberis]